MLLHRLTAGALQRFDIAGRSRMSKRQLVAALSAGHWGGPGRARRSVVAPRAADAAAVVRRAAIWP